ncbi:MAG: hypothetical protein AAFP03_06700 [Cyanobacteria bacterium J06598_3]
MPDLSNHPRRLQRLRLALIALGFAISGVSIAPSFAGSAVPPQSLALLEDGLYLFGQSPQRDQSGVTYAVLSIYNHRTVGAFYQPRSVFNCFSGQVRPHQLTLDVVDAYTQTVHPYAVSVISDTSLVADKSTEAIYTLDGFYQIDKHPQIDDLTVQDAEILAVCQADLSLGAKPE